MCAFSVLFFLVTDRSLIRFIFIFFYNSIVKDVISIHLNTWAWSKGKSSLYVDCFQCCVGLTTELFIACLVINTDHKKIIAY